MPLLYDAAMERLLFDGRPLVHPLHFDGMADRTVIAGSLSKEHRMIGWRVGWVAGPAELVESVGWMHVYNTTTPTGVARAAATAVLRGDQGHVADAVAELERRRDTIMRRARRLAAGPPAGGWSLLIDADRDGDDGERAVARADRAGRHRRHADDRLGRRGRRPARAAGVQRRARRAPADDPGAIAGTRLEVYGSSPRSARA